MKRHQLLLAACGIAVAACSENPTNSQSSTPATPNFQEVQQGQGTVHVMLRIPEVAADRAKPSGGGGGGGGGTGIFYHGGPIISSTNVAVIYWSPSVIYDGGPAPGTTGAGASDGSLIGFFLRNLGGSPYFNINSTYYDGNNVHVQNSVTYTQFWAHASTPGTNVSDLQVQQEVLGGLNGGALTYDPSTLYVVFTGAGVNLGGGFGTQYCAYHGHFSSSYGEVKYAVMPHDIDDPSGCSALSGSPNGDPAADTEVNTLAHETEETTTDPNLNAWWDRRGYENADKCAWTFGTTYHTSNNSVANMNLGGKDFLVQQNWVNAGRGGCLLSWS